MDTLFTNSTLLIIGAGLVAALVVAALIDRARRPLSPQQLAEKGLITEGVILAVKPAGGDLLELTLHVQQPGGVSYTTTASFAGNPADPALQVGQAVRLWLHQRNRRRVLRVEPDARPRGFAFEQPAEPVDFGRQAGADTPPPAPAAAEQPRTYTVVWNSSSGIQPVTTDLSGLLQGAFQSVGAELGDARLAQILQQVVGAVQNAQDPEHLRQQEQQLQRALESGAIDPNAYAEIRQVLEALRNRLGS